MSKLRRFKKVVEHNDDLLFAALMFMIAAVLFTCVYLAVALWYHNLLFINSIMPQTFIAIFSGLGLLFYLPSRKVFWEEMRW